MVHVLGVMHCSLHSPPESEVVQCTELMQCSHRIRELLAETKQLQQMSHYCAAGQALPSVVSYVLELQV